MIKKIFGFMAAVVMLLGVFGLAGCSGKEEYSTEHFRYYIVKNGIGEKFVEIIGLTEAGSQQKILVIPETIDEKPVSLIGRSAGWGGPVGADFTSDKLEKLFFYTSEIEIAGGTFSRCSSLKKIIVINSDESLGYSNGIESKSGKIVLFLINSKASSGVDSKYQPSNISYYFNFDTNINYGFYWIDDIDLGEKIEYIPENPVRDGYEFGGWYQEPECENEWDFETSISQETSLYAKWIKK